MWSAILFLQLVMAEPGAAHPKNLVLISIDTLRQDRVGCYQSGPSLTPILDRLAGESVLFERAFCQTPLTSPSMCSAMTSEYPHAHGSIRNGMRMKGKPLTLATLLSQRGYHTAAFISNWTLKARLTGLKAGFDLYDDEFQSKRWAMFKGESSAEEINERVFAWMESAQEPFLLWVHYSDPHAPYMLHEEYLSSMDPGADRASPASRYDTEVAHVDHQLGLFLDRLKQQPLQGPLAMMVVADHGESLGEHDFYGHGRQIFDPMMKIPFLIKDPGLPAGRRVSSLARILDVAPTALDLLGVDVPAEMKGQSLLPCILADTPGVERVYMESYPGAVPNVPIYKQTRRHRMPSHIGMFQPPWKAIYEVPSDHLSLYNVDQDPKELQDLAGTRSDQAIQEMRGMLLSWYDSQAPSGDPLEDSTEDTALTKEDINALKSLGYLE